LIGSDFMIYLDNAATTALSEKAREAMEPYFSAKFGNPSSIYRFGQEAKQAIESSRRTVSALLGVSPREIYFTGGGTESDNWAITGMFFSAKTELEVFTDSIEHHAVLESCAFVESLGAKVRRIPVDREGFLSLEALEEALQKSVKSAGEKLRLVSVMAANNEIGTIERLSAIGRIAKKYGALFHSDAVQAFGQIPLSVEDAGIDLLSASSHKIHGPKGVGLLYVRKGVKLSSFFHGGAQERGLRAGTENVPGIVGFATAAEEAFSGMEEKGKRKVALRNRLMKRLLEEVPGASITGVNPLVEPSSSASSAEPFERLPGNVHLCIEGVEGESLLLQLDQKGICASSGSACASGSLEPSHVLLAIGKSREEAFSGLRLSLDERLTEEELEYTVEAIKEGVKKLRG